MNFTGQRAIPAEEGASGQCAGFPGATVVAITFHSAWKLLIALLGNLLNAYKFELVDNEPLCVALTPRHGITPFYVNRPQACPQYKNVLSAYSMWALLSSQVSTNPTFMGPQGKRHITQQSAKSVVTGLARKNSGPVKGMGGGVLN